MKKGIIVTVVALLLTTGAFARETIKTSTGTTVGYVEGSSAYNDRENSLGSYRNGKTYLNSGRLFGYGNLLSALVVLDAQSRGKWK